MVSRFLIPVLDLMGGQVVRGRGGQRAHYRPICSGLCPSSDPLTVCEAFRAVYGLDEIYVADLDAIAGAPAALAIYRRLREAGFSLMVDAGLGRAEDAEGLVAAGVETVVAGLESLESPVQLRRLIERFGARVLFSLDLKSGWPLSNGTAWGKHDAGEVLDQACAVGARRVLLLDLARVGMGGGTGTEALAREALARSEGLQVIVGGGVRGEEDIRRARELGIHGALVATVLHDRLIRPQFAQALGSPDSIEG